jgi:hypothetical protein
VGGYVKEAKEEDISLFYKDLSFQLLSHFFRMIRRFLTAKDGFGSQTPQLLSQNQLLSQLLSQSF